MLVVTLYNKKSSCYINYYMFVWIPPHHLVQKIVHYSERLHKYWIWNGALIIRFCFRYENKFTVLAKILQIDHGYGWCYASCSECSKKLEHINDSFVCLIYNKECRYPIIRNKTNRKMETHPRDLICLKDMEIKETLKHQKPENIRHLTGKSFVFKIKLTDYNLKDGFENYTVVKIFEADKIVETYEFRSENTEEAEMKGKRNAGKMLTDGKDGLAKNVLAASDSGFPFWQEITHSKAISFICFSTSSIKEACIDYLCCCITIKKGMNDETHFTPLNIKSFSRRESHAGIRIPKSFSPQQYLYLETAMIQLDTQHYSSTKVAYQTVRRKHEANFNKPVLDGISSLVKERPERGAGITNCAGEELIGTAGASADAAVVGWITGVGGCGKRINFKNDNEIMGLEMVFVDDKIELMGRIYCFQVASIPHPPSFQKSSLRLHCLQLPALRT
ncbi:hypothetical protein LXL04_025750 [Taraxacum kok-saghyz]